MVGGGTVPRNPSLDIRWRSASHAGRVSNKRPSVALELVWGALEKGGESCLKGIEPRSTVPSASTQTELSGLTTHEGGSAILHCGSGSILGMTRGQTAYTDW